VTQERLRYRLLTGPDDRSFCERVSQALAEGYRLYGGPAVTCDGERVVVAQAVVLDQAPSSVSGSSPELGESAGQGSVTDRSGGE